MNDMKTDSNLTDNTDAVNQEASTCGSGCGCHSARPTGKMRVIVGVIVLVAAGVLVSRAVMKENGAKTAPAANHFATLAVPVQTPGDATAKPAATDTLKEIASLSELNAVATDSFGVFVYLPGKGPAAAKAPVAQMQGAARTIEPQLRGGKIAMFALKVDSPDYDQVASQVTVPGVLAMVKGKGMSATSGDITETKLVQALVTASSAGGCGPASGGCGPSGCN